MDFKSGLITVSRALMAGRISTLWANLYSYLLVVFFVKESDARDASYPLA